MEGRGRGGRSHLAEDARAAREGALDHRIADGLVLLEAQQAEEVDAVERLAEVAAHEAARGLDAVEQRRRPIELRDREAIEGHGRSARWEMEGEIAISPARS